MNVMPPRGAIVVWMSARPARWRISVEAAILARARSRPPCSVGPARGPALHPGRDGLWIRRPGTANARSPARRRRLGGRRRGNRGNRPGPHPRCVPSRCRSGRAASGSRRRASAAPWISGAPEGARLDGEWPPVYGRRGSRLRARGDASSRPRGPRRDAAIGVEEVRVCGRRLMTLCPPSQALPRSPDCARRDRTPSPPSDGVLWPDRCSPAVRRVGSRPSQSGAADRPEPPGAETVL